MKDQARSPAAMSSRRGAVDIDGEYRALERALKWLSSDRGNSDVRAATDALTKLSGSRNLEIREDAQAVLHAARERGWFEGTSPSYEVLSGIAWRSLGYQDSQRTRKRISHLLLFVLLFCFGAALVLIGSDGVEAPELRRYVVALVAALLAGLGILLLIRRRRS